MRRALYAILALLISTLPMVAADTPWLYGRIVDVQRSVTTKTKAWVVNTPITEDEVSYTISVHIHDKILVGSFDLTPEESPPPEEWTTNYPVKIQVVGDRLFVRAPTGDLRLRIVRRKNARLMAPLTADEKKRLEQMESPAGSLVGFSDEKSGTGGNSSKGQSAETVPPLPPPAPLPPTMGLVNVRSTPYLSEVLVDGESMGYTPAKVSLLPGKHSFRVAKTGYKPWTKEITITVGSELTLDASLEKN